ncbi:hypothetical protein L207DRAFT_217551 [Hyaloscypha variabilis F]|uniref:Uncharacterized protein n=1 Tax=Hyaloscypha variabilis (strain UAMH 11265 / GT02V1 / F) TaxID=1149755 RepID=A0A2J6S780_HYAVF|nr:hypothetical protein L207DRAFT_217551 [Hyaloscypha variabilis F]
MRLKSESEQKRGNRIGALASNLAGRRGILASAAMWSQEATDGSPAVDRIKVEYIFVDDLATVKDAQRRRISGKALSREFIGEVWGLQILPVTNWHRCIVEVNPNLGEELVDIGKLRSLLEPNELPLSATERSSGARHPQNPSPALREYVLTSSKLHAGRSGPA